MKKRLLLIMMAILPMVAIADESGTCGKNLTWTYTEYTKTLSIEGTGAMTNYTYTSPAPWHQYKYNVNKINIGPNVTTIGDYAFAYLEYAKNVTIGDAVTSIGNSAFNSCTKLSKIIIPNSVTSIDYAAFQNCTALYSATIGNSVTSIGNFAFNSCSSLRSITIPQSLTSIGVAVFWFCSALNSIIVESGNTIYDSRDNCNAIIDTENNTLLYGCNNTVIPSSVTAIANYSFREYSGLTSIVIPNSVTRIGKEAFKNCSGLTSVSIGNGVTSIDDDAFSGCSQLNNVTLNSNTIVSKNYTSNNNIKTIFGNQVKEFIIGDEVTSIGDWAFYAYLTVLTSITIGNNVTSIGNEAFKGCSGLTSINIPNNVTSIGNEAFMGCSGLTSINISNNVNSLGDSAFRDCYKLATIIVPNSVISIGNEAFFNCSKMQDFYCYVEQLPTIGTDVFKNASTVNATLHVPGEAIELYKATEQWKEFANILALANDDPKPSGIADVRSKMAEVRGAYYDLNGRKLTEEPTKKGIYINNGQKVIVK